MKFDKERNYTFFQNKECEFFPCHKKLKNDFFNCLFCFCPLYLLDCKGDFSILENGIKDCSLCVFPHIKENYEKIVFILRKEIFGKEK